MIWDEPLPYDPKLDYRFVFDFHDERGQSPARNVTKLFRFENLDAAEYERLVKDVSITGLGFEISPDGLRGHREGLDQIEYDARVSGHEEIAGFSSEEIHGDDMDIVAEGLRDTFVRKGFACSPIVTMTRDEYQRLHPAVVGIDENGVKTLVISVEDLERHIVMVVDDGITDERPEELAALQADMRLVVASGLIELVTICTRAEVADLAAKARSLGG